MSVPTARLREPVFNVINRSFDFLLFVAAEGLYVEGSFSGVSGLVLNLLIDIWVNRKKSKPNELPTKFRTNSLRWMY